MNAPISFETIITERKYTQLVNRFDQTTRILWSFMKPHGRACFNSGLLQDIADFGDSLRLNKGRYLTNRELETVDFVVLASYVPGIFNLGGDLDTFRSKIQSGDKDALRNYAYLCVKNIWTRLNHYDANITTISLVEGHALGGGFEAALTGDIIMAEEGSILGLPEILFNLFPGMGALSLLSRKIGLREAEKIVLSGETYSVEELYEHGVIDVITPKGEGRQAVEKWIKDNFRRKNGYAAVQRSKQCIMRISYEELIEIADIWVDFALKLEYRNLRMMDRLVHAQNKRQGTTGLC